MNKILLTDVDGVLLDWEAKFGQWMGEQGYAKIPGNENSYSIGAQYGVDHDASNKLISDFNSSTSFADISPWRDSVEYIKRLSAEGWKIITITTAGHDPRTYGLRMSNFDKVFGPGVVNELYILILHGDKGEQLQHYKDLGYYWVEDKPSNAELGFRYGLKPLLMDNPHNHDYNGSVQRVKDWEEIYKIITS